MAGQAVGDLIEWLRTPAAKGLSPKARLVLLTIADRVLDMNTRQMRHFKRDDCSLHERLRQVADVSPEGLKKIFQELAERDLEVRVQIIRKGRPFTDKAGRPVYACKGHSMEFRLPDLHAMTQLAMPVDKEAV